MSVLLPWNVGKVTCIEGLPVKKLMKVETKEDQTKIRKIQKKTLYPKNGGKFENVKETGFRIDC